MPEPVDTSVFILAAGRGERMRPLTDFTPKPLLLVDGKPLVCHHLERLSRTGFKNIVINYAHLGDQIVETLGNGKQFGLSIQYSPEPEGALETAGGIVRAIPLLESDPFVCMNADIWTDFDFTTLLHPLDCLARLVMVDNPAHHAEGDFNVGPGGLLTTAGDGERLTYSGIALFNQRAFRTLAQKKQPLAPLLRDWIALRQVEYLVHDGVWQDIGTPDRLEEINLRAKTAPTE